jgi:Protein of unknown function (DUF2652)
LPCGACQTVSNLTLKFIAHFGYIKEIKLAQFVKATGTDIIVAHRLLKNDVGSDQYILMTDPCCDAVGHEDANPKLQWVKSSQSYDAIGNVGYQFATLSNYKTQIPRPQPRRASWWKRGRQSGGRDQRPLRAVYQTLVNVDKRPSWRVQAQSIAR